jgi:hypothetical protein
MDYQQNLNLLLQHQQVEPYLRDHLQGTLTTEKILSMLEEYGVLTTVKTPPRLCDDPRLCCKVVVETSLDNERCMGRGPDMLLASLRCLLEVRAMTERATWNAMHAISLMDNCE